MRRFIYPFLLPNGLLFVGVLFLLAQEQLPLEIDTVLQIVPYAVVLIGFLIGWRFNRTRLIFAIGLLLLADLIPRVFTPGMPVPLVVEAVAFCLPLNLLIISWFRERGLLNLNCALWLLFLALEISTLGGLIYLRPELLDRFLMASLVSLPGLQGLALSQPALLANGIVLILFAVRALRHASAFEAGFFWAHAVILTGFLEFGHQPFRLVLTGAGVILIMGLMESSHSLAYRDELTGLPGRRALNEALAKLGSRYTLAMLDIDHFKKFNDTHGHDVGDQVLRMVAGRLASVRGGGKVFRFGGEEFAVVIPRRAVQDVLPYLERLRQVIERARFIPRGKDRPRKKPKKRSPGTKRHKTLKVTISIGAAERSKDLAAPGDVIKAADVALYKAKKEGRNRVCY